jgi:hypothetical protein
MGGLKLLGLTVALLCGGSAATAGEPSVLAPYRFQPPDLPLSTLESERARIYRSQVQRQLDHLELDDARGRLDGPDRRLLLETRGELERMDSVVQKPSPVDLGVSGGRLLPSLSPGLLPSSR